MGVLLLFTIAISSIVYLGTVVNNLIFYNELIGNVIANSFLVKDKMNTSNRLDKDEFGCIANNNLLG